MDVLFQPQMDMDYHGWNGMFINHETHETKSPVSGRAKFHLSRKPGSRWMFFFNHGL
jgi:hypothetical protein